MYKNQKDYYTLIFVFSAIINFIRWYCSISKKKNTHPVELIVNVSHEIRKCAIVMEYLLSQNSHLKHCLVLSTMLRQD